jgi:hypothetical protein
MKTNISQLEKIMHEHHDSKEDLLYLLVVGVIMLIFFILNGGCKDYFTNLY